MNKNEARYFRTAAKMDEALIKLIEKKDFEYITVKEICDAAGVNRSTFYLHYENTVDLLKETTQYITDGFLSYFNVDKATADLQIQECDRAELIFITPRYLVPYLTYVKENRRVFKTALEHFGELGFEGVYQKMYKFIFAPVLDRFGFPEGEREYVAKFYLTGITAIVMEWLNKNCREPVVEITEIIIKCTLGKFGYEEG